MAAPLKKSFSSNVVNNPTEFCETQISQIPLDPYPGLTYFKTNLIIYFQKVFFLGK